MLGTRTRFCVLAGFLLAAAATPGLADLLRQRGDLVILAREVEAAVPSASAGVYADPTPAERETFARALSLLAAGDLRPASRVAAEFNYDVIRYTDTITRCWHYILREQEPITLGWGTYIISASRSAGDLLLEAPHPKADIDTPAFAAEIYRALDGGALLIAGAHRDAAPDDLANACGNENSIFHLAHQWLSASTTHVIVVHGFSLARRPDYPYAVYSNGSADPSVLLYHLANDLIARGISCGVYDGISWTDLGATYDVQGAYTRSIGGEFIHAEFAREVRDSGELRGVVVDSFGYVLAPLLGPWPSY